MQHVLKLLGYLLTSVVAPLVGIVAAKHHVDPDTAGAISIAIAGAGARMLHVAQPPHSGPPNYFTSPYPPPPPPQPPQP